MKIYEKLFLLYFQGGNKNKPKGFPLLKLHQQNKANYKGVYGSHANPECIY